MSNNCRTKHRAARTPSRDKIAAQLHHGWTDYRAGVGFPKDYDCWGENHQRNYEQGRRLAAVVSAGGPVPAWARNRLCPPMTQGLASHLHSAWSAEIKFFIDTSAL